MNVKKKLSFVGKKVWLFRVKVGIPTLHAISKRFCLTIFLFFSCCARADMEMSKRLFHFQTAKSILQYFSRNNNFS